MANKQIPPPPLGDPFESSAWQQFFELVRRYLNQPTFISKAGNPTILDIPNGSYAVWKNTSSGIVRLWVNDGDTLKSTPLT